MIVLSLIFGFIFVVIGFSLGYFYGDRHYRLSIKLIERYRLENNKMLDWIVELEQKMMEDEDG